MDRAQLFAGVLALALCAFAVTLFSIDDRPGESEDSSLAGVPDAAEIPTGGDLTATDPGLRTPQDAAETVPDPDAPEPLYSPIGEFRTVTGRVVDADGEPIAGAELSLAGSRPLRVLGTSDIEGQLDVTLQLDGVLLYELRRQGEETSSLGVVADGWAGRLFWAPSVAENETVQLGTVVLDPGIDVLVRARSEEGWPLAGAEVAWFPARAFPEDEETARTARREGISVTSDGPHYVPGAQADSQGLARLRGVPLGAGFASGRARTTDHGWSQVVEVDALSAGEVALVLPPGDPARRIEGVALQPDGSPAKGALVTLVNEAEGSLLFGTRVEADVEGRFSFSVDEDGSYRLTARHAENGYPPVGRENVLPGLPSVELWFEEPSWLEVALVDPSGVSIPWGHVRLIPSLGATLDPCGESGVARVFLPEATFTVQAFAPGFQPKHFGPYEPADLEDGLDLTLQPGASLSGRVVHAGEPVEGAAVFVAAGFAAEDRLGLSRGLARAEDPFVVLSGADRGEADATTDEEGYFVTTLHRDGRHTVRVEAEGFPVTVLGPYRWTIAGGAKGLELELVPGGALEGTVRTRDGVDAGGLLVGVSNGWGLAFTRTTDAEGRYRFDDLQPGNWQVRPCEGPAAEVEALNYGLHPSVDVRWDCAVASGEVTTFDLDLTGQGAHLLRGRIAIGGLDPTGAQVRLHPEGSQGRAYDRMLASDEVDGEGNFELSLEEGGRRLLVVEAPRGWTLRQELDLNPGTNEWSAEIVTGALLFNDDPPTDAGGREILRLAVRWESPDGLVFLRPFSLENPPVGGVEVQHLPVGRVEIGRIDWFSTDGGWSMLLETEVAAGRTIKAEWP